MDDYVDKYGENKNTTKIVDNLNGNDTIISGAKSALEHRKVKKLKNMLNAIMV